MKKLLFIVAILSTMLGSFESARAGYSSNTRAKCRWWSKKFAANCHLATRRCGISYSTSHDGSCDFAYTHIDRHWGCSCGSTSQAHSQNGWGGSWGYLNLYCGTSGGALNELLADAGVMESGDPGSETGTEPNTQDYRLQPEFMASDRTVVLSGISIKLSSATGSTVRNSISADVWVPEDDSVGGVEDSIVTAAKTISGGTVTLFGSELLITGGLFTAADFVVETTADGRTTATYVGGVKTVPVPESVDMDALAVRTGGDILSDDDGAMAKLAGTATGAVTMTLQPNPASSTLQVSVREAAENTATLGIYDLSGKKVSTEQVSFEKGAADLKIDIAALPAGNYFLMIKGTDLKIVKQFTKQ